MSVNCKLFEVKVFNRAFNSVWIPIWILGKFLNSVLITWNSRFVLENFAESPPGSEKFLLPEFGTVWLTFSEFWPGWLCQPVDDEGWLEWWSCCWLSSWLGEYRQTPCWLYSTPRYVPWRGEESTAGNNVMLIHPLNSLEDVVAVFI